MHNPFDIIDARLSNIESLLLDIKHVQLPKITISDPTDEYETITQLATRRKLSKATIHSDMKNGLPYEKNGRATRIKRSESDKYYAEKSKKSKTIKN